MTIFRTPPLDLDDDAVLGEISQMRSSLESVVRTPRRWTGRLRRTTQARAIQGSNTIEGYTVTDQDAVAAVDDEEPLSADQQTWAEILGYRRVLTYVLNLAPLEAFRPDAMTLRSMHFMLLEHDLSKGPGRYRSSAVYVRDDKTEENVYEGPQAVLVPGLVDELFENLASARDEDPLITGAMAHLNLVMIHPFRDGNGRMARALQTLVLTRGQIREPTFSSIEEWLGSNTEDYYRVLAATGQGGWNPERDAHLWLKFNLRAHHMQAQTLQRRFNEADLMWGELDTLVARHGLPDRAADPLFDAALRLRVRRPSYAERAGIENRTATRDLARLVTAGLLTPHGQTRGRYYLASADLRDLAADVRSGRPPISDPYPGFRDELRRA